MGASIVLGMPRSLLACCSSWLSFVLFCSAWAWLPTAPQPEINIMMAASSVPVTTTHRTDRRSIGVLCPSLFTGATLLDTRHANEFYLTPEHGARRSGGPV